MNNDDVTSIIILFSFGLYSVLAAIFNWNDFFNNWKTKNVSYALGGRFGARIFYYFFGFVMIILSILFYLGIIPMNTNK